MEFWAIVFSVWGVGRSRPFSREYQTQPSFATHLLTAKQCLRGSQMSGGKRALDASPEDSWVSEPSSALSQACMHPPQLAPGCSLEIFIASLHLFSNSETFVQLSGIRYGRSHFKCIFEMLRSHVSSYDSKNPNMRSTITAPVCKDEVQLAAEVHSSSQGSTNVPYVSHSRDDVVRQQLICF